MRHTIKQTTLPSQMIDLTRALSATTSHRIKISPRRSVSGARHAAAGPGGTTDAPFDSQGAPNKAQLKKMVYKSGAMSIGSQIKNQLGSSGGAEQRHGRPPDSQGVPDKVQLKKKRLFGGARWRHGRPPGSQGPTTISPPSAIALKDSSVLSVGVTVHSATVPFYPPFLLSLRQVLLPQLRNTSRPQ